MDKGSSGGALMAEPRRVGARRLLVAWLPVIAWAALIFVLSAQPDLRFVPDAGTDFVVRKLGHMGVFGILALSIRRAMARSTPVRRPGVAAMLLAVLYAATDEIHQGQVVGRHAALTDVGIDATGALIARVLAGVLVSRRR